MKKVTFALILLFVMVLNSAVSVPKDMITKRAVNKNDLAKHDKGVAWTGSVGPTFDKSSSGYGWYQGYNRKIQVNNDPVTGPMVGSLYRQLNPTYGSGTIGGMIGTWGSSFSGLSQTVYSSSNYQGSPYSTGDPGGRYPYACEFINGYFFGIFNDYNLPIGSSDSQAMFAVCDATFGWDLSMWSNPERAESVNDGSTPPGAWSGIGDVVYNPNDGYYYWAQNWVYDLASIDGVTNFMTGRSINPADLSSWEWTDYTDVVFDAASDTYDLTQLDNLYPVYCKDINGNGTGYGIAVGIFTDKNYVMTDSLGNPVDVTDHPRLGYIYTTNWGADWGTGDFKSNWITPGNMGNNLFTADIYHLFDWYNSYTDSTETARLNWPYLTWNLSAVATEGNYVHVMIKVVGGSTDLNGMYYTNNEKAIAGYYDVVGEITASGVNWLSANYIAAFMGIDNGLTEWKYSNTHDFSIGYAGDGVVYASWLDRPETMYIANTNPDPNKDYIDDAFFTCSPDNGISWDINKTVMFDGYELKYAANITNTRTLQDEGFAVATHGSVNGNLLTVYGACQYYDAANIAVDPPTDWFDYQQFLKVWKIEGNLPAVPSSITVNTPNGGEVIMQGSQLEILWSDNISENVKIELFKSDLYYSTISSATESNGSFIWDVTGMSSDTDYKIRISSVLTPETINDISNEYFTIGGGNSREVYVGICDRDGIPFNFESAPYDGVTFRFWIDSRPDEIIDQNSFGYYNTIGMGVSVVWCNIGKFVTPWAEGDILNLYVEDDNSPNGYFYRQYPITLNNSFEPVYVGLDEWFGQGTSNYGDGLALRINQINKSIEISAPNGGEFIGCGSQYEIVWLDNFDENVKIDVYKSGSFFSTIEGSYLSTGSYTWSVPLGFETGTDFRIRISSSIDSTLYDESNSDITIYLPDGNDLPNGATAITVPHTGNYSIIPDTDVDWYRVYLTVGEIYQFNTSSSEMCIYNYLYGPGTEDGTDVGEYIGYCINWDYGYADPLTINFTPTTDGYYYLNTAWCNWYVKNGSKNIKKQAKEPKEAKATGNYTLNVTSSSVPTVFESFETGNYKMNDWYFAGDSEWFIDNTDAYEGSYSSRSGYIGDLQSSSMKIDLEFVEDGTIGFFIKVSSEYGWDYLNFFIDGTSMGSWCGFMDWTYFSYSVPAGVHTISWMYAKDGNVASGSDCAWVDEICATGLLEKITLFTPNGGEVLSRGTQFGITWGENIEDHIKIELMENDTLTVLTLVDSIESTGSYLWSLPSDISGSDYKIKISSSQNPVNYDISDSTFAIIPGKIMITSPNGGEILNRNEAFEIKWHDNLSENVKIELFKDGSFNSTIVSSTPSDGSYLWTIPIVPEGDDFQIKISSVVMPALHKDMSDGDFTLLTEGTISIIYPLSGEVFEMLENSTITWTDDIPEDVLISLYKDSMLVTSFITISDGECDWNFYDINMTSGSDYKIKIESSLLGDVSDESGFFTIKGTNNVNGGVSGIWTEEFSPYVLTDSTYIETLSSLIIMPRVKVNGAQFHNPFNVIGKLEASGLFDGMIQFKDIDLSFNNSISTDSSKVKYSVFNRSLDLTKTAGNSSININNNSKVIIQNSIVQNMNDYGIVVNNSSPAITNCLITSNSGGMKFVNSTSYYIANNTVAGNIGNGLYFDGNSDPMLINNIVYGNGGYEVYLNHNDSDPEFYYNDIEGGQAGFGLNSGVSYNGSYSGNLNVDPLLADSTYVISEISPCRDTGYPDLTNELLGYLYIPVKDLAGNFRLNGEIDMGCYEYCIAVITPESPTNIVIGAVYGTLTISWDATPNTNSYLIYSSSDPYGTFEYLATVGSNSWNTPISTDTKKFYYVISSSEPVVKNTHAVKTDSTSKKIKIQKIEDILK